MPIISTLGVSIRAKADQFLSAMRKVGSVVKSIVGAFGRLARSVAPILLAFAGLSGLTLTAMIQQTRMLGDQVGKMADEIGIGVNELLGLRKAAELTGTTTAVLDKALQRMSRRIGEAVAGYGEGVKGLREMGLAAADLAGMTAFNQFKAIADRIGKMSSQAQKAAAVYTTFGRQGSSLLNMFNLLGAGIDEVTQKNIRLQGDFGRVDLRPIEEMNDRAVDLKSAIQGISLKALIGLAPQAARFIELITEGVVKLRDRILPKLLVMQRKLFLGVLSGVEKAFPVMFAAWINVREMIKRVWVIIKTMIEGVKTLVGWFVSLVDTVRGSTGAVSDMLQGMGINNATEAFIALTSALSRGVTASIEFVKFWLTIGPNLVGTIAAIGKNAFGAWRVMVEEVYARVFLGIDEMRAAFKAAFRPSDANTAALAQAQRNIENFATDSEKRINMAMARVDLQPLWTEFETLKKTFFGIGDDLIDGVMGDVAQYRKVFDALKNTFDKLRSVGGEDIFNPEINIGDEDRKLLKKIFKGAALFDSQAAHKILASNQRKPAPVANVADAIKKVFDPLLSFGDPLDEFNANLKAGVVAPIETLTADVAMFMQHANRSAALNPFGKVTAAAMPDFGPVDEDSFSGFEDQLAVSNAAIEAAAAEMNRATSPARGKTSAKADEATIKQTSILDDIRNAVKNPTHTSEPFMHMRF